MTLFYSLAAFIVLAAVALLLYWETINILYKADYQFLQDQVETIQYLLNNKSANLASLNQEIIEEPGKVSASIYRYYIRVFDADKKIMLETPRIESIMPATQFVNAQALKSMKSTYRWYVTNEKTYLIIQSPVQIGHQKNGVIQIALDISYQHSVISDQKILMLALLASLLCSLVIGFLIAHRSLRSLYELTSTVTNITATSLHKRVDPTTLPKELAALGVAFNQMLDRLESSFARLKQFSSDLAHELRTPIHTIRGQTEMILSHTHSLEDYQRVMESNLEELQRVSQFIENILFLARAEHPQRDLQLKPIQAEQEIAGVCDFYQALADEKNIQLVYEGNATFPANQIMFRRLISNLLSNALHYTPDQGRVEFSLSQPDDKTAKIVMRDTGIGIAEEHLPKLFDRFYRVDSDRSSQSGGTGLGLPIVKSIIDLHRGTIGLNSVVGVGTTITMTFPVN